MKKDYFTIILWRKPEKKGITIEEVLNESMPIFNYLNDLPKWLKPNYTFFKRRPVEIQLTKEYVLNKLKSGISKEDNRVFVELGYLFTLFSEKDESGSQISWSFKLGNTDEKFINSIIIDFPTDMLNTYRIQSKEIEILLLFNQLVRLFEPFFGCILSDVISIKYESILTDGIPATLYGYNYWNEDMIERIGMERIIHLVELGEIEYEEPGFIKLFDGFVDVFDDEQMKKRKEIEDYLLYNDETIFNKNESK